MLNMVAFNPDNAKMLRDYGHVPTLNEQELRNMHLHGLVVSFCLAAVALVRRILGHGHARETQPPADPTSP